MASSQDIRLSSSASSHRLPTVSASEALQSLKNTGLRCLSTGLPQLDSVLRPSASSSITFMGGSGLARGQVTEIYGPPGVGKTTFAAQLCANTIQADYGVVWIDCAAPAVAHRLKEIISPVQPDKETPSAENSRALPERFQHYFVPALAHLLALIVHPPASFPTPKTGLIVIDDLSTLFENAYPRKVGDHGPSGKTEAAKWAAGRRFAVMNELISKLGKMAAMSDVRILLTCQTITRMRQGAGAILLPAISGTEWDAGISTRLVLFRDWPPAQIQGRDIDAEKLRKLRFIAVEKLIGSTASQEGLSTVIPFTIESSGVLELAIDTADVAIHHLTSPIRPPKRPYAEIADSEDEEPESDELYGWAEEDDLAAEGLVIDEAALTAAGLNDEQV